MPLPLTVSFFSKIQIGFTFLVPAHPGSPGKRAVKRVCVCACVRACVRVCVCVWDWQWKICENRLTVGEVMGKSWASGSFEWRCGVWLVAAVQNERDRISVRRTTYDDVAQNGSLSVNVLLNADLLSRQVLPPRIIIITIRYDTIRDAVVTCARKPTWVSLIYRTEPTTKKCKNRKTKE